MSETKTAKQLTHYIAMNGSHGCLPDSCSAYQYRMDAIDSLVSSLDLTTRQRQELIRMGDVECKPAQGAEYCEVVSCQCSTPWVHDEMGDESDWPDYQVEGD